MSTISPAVRALAKATPKPAIREFLARELDAPVREMRDYSIRRHMWAHASNDWSSAGFEREVEQHLARVRGPARFGFQVPVSAWEGVMGRAALSTSTDGDNLTYERPLAFIDYLHPLSVVLALGAERVNARGASAWTVIEQTGSETVSWLGEQSAVTESNLTLATGESLTPKTLRARAAFTEQLFRMSSDAIEARVLRSLASTSAAALDMAAINGATNGPAGLLSSGDIEVIPIGADGGAPTYAHICALEEAPSLANVEGGAAGFATTPQVRRKLRQTERAAGNGMVWENDGLLGKRSRVSNAVPANLTKGVGTDLHAILYSGNWADMVVADWSGLELLIDPYTRGDEGEIVVRVFWMINTGLRREESFAVIVDADPDAA